MDEFAMGSSTETSHFGPTRNPWNPEYVAGGSSGGSAAATAAGECIAALGSDTGGSIRQPASHCGVVGLKPTYGRVSRYGLVAFASSLDQIGPLAQDVRDCALLLQAISGHDPLDTTSMPGKVPNYEACLGKSIKGLRVGVPEEYLGPGLDDEVEVCVNRGLEILKSLGAETVRVFLPHTRYVLAAYHIIASAEASSNLARYDGVRYGYRAPERDLDRMLSRTRSQGFGPEVTRRVMLGTYALSAGYHAAYYRKASQARTLVIEDFQRAFKVCDILLTPVSPIPPFRLGEKIEDPLTMYLTDVFTLSANLAGIPALSIPCGTSGTGLPIGLQLLGDYFDEETVLRAAFAFEQATPHLLRAMTTL
jgi:aspartyl-tRNA(Asn)/glutamyl-tRNA(Gln) amidotransferase subunit A